MKKLLCGIAMTGLFILSLPGCGQTEAADSGAPLSQAKTDSASENTDTAMNDSADEDMAKAYGNNSIKAVQEYNFENIVEHHNSVIADILQSKARK